jgi:hypothetical protein
MERISHVSHGNKTVLVADCSNCAPQELALVIDNVPAYVMKEPLGSVLLLADFSGSVFTKETVEHLKLAAVFDRPHIKKSAWVLTHNLDKTLCESVRSFSGREIRTFATRQEALEYLLSDTAEA